MRLRVLLALLFAACTFACVRPLVADAHILDHGKTVFFHSIYVKPDEVIDGDLNVVFGDAEIAGTVKGDVNTIFGRCVKDEGAAIGGQEHCITDDAPRTIAPWIANSAALGTFADQDKQLFVKLGASAIVLLVFLLFPVRMRLALDRIERHPGISALVGIGAVVAIVPVALLLLVSIVGIPLIFVEVAGLFAGVWLGTGAVALLIGRRLAELVWPATTPSPLWALVLGLVVVSAAETVPYVGWAVTAIVWLVGLGAAILAFFRTTSVDAMRRVPAGGPPMPTRPY